MKNYTVQLNDPLYGRVVLVPVTASNATAASDAAEAAPGISGPISSFEEGQIVDTALVMTLTGNDLNGNPMAGPTRLPIVPTSVPVD